MLLGAFALIQKAFVLISCFMGVGHTPAVGSCGAGPPLYAGSLFSSIAKYGADVCVCRSAADAHHRHFQLVILTLMPTLSLIYNIVFERVE